MSKKTILVAGATGAQGGGVIEPFLNNGWKVRALVRSPERADARALEARGVELAQGEFGDSDAVRHACEGADAVFSMQMAMQNEVEHARIMADAARLAGVPIMIHSSVSATGWREGLSREDAHYSKGYWDCKEEVERLMQDAGFEVLTILKPAFLMENFIEPKASTLFPDLKNQAIVSALALDRPFPTVAVCNIGAAAYAAATRPEDFNGKSVDLAGDAGTIADYGRIIGNVVGAEIKIEHLPPEQVVARGQNEGWVESQDWSAKFGYTARPEHQRAFGIEPTSFRAWAEAHVDALKVATGSA